MKFVVIGVLVFFAITYFEFKVAYHGQKFESFFYHLKYFLSTLNRFIVKILGNSGISAKLVLV